MAISPHSNPEVAGSSLARYQCPHSSGFTPDSGLLGGGLRCGITSAVGRTVEYPPPPTRRKARMWFNVLRLFFSYDRFVATRMSYINLVILFHFYVSV
ncbi:hypothetical protein Hanom_Chr10g00941361 [Helianthus anomalus]